MRFSTGQIVVILILLAIGGLITFAYVKGQPRTESLAETGTDSGSAWGIRENQTSEKASATPSLFMAEDQFDAGIVDAGETVSHVFRLENRGTGDLVVRLVKLTCPTCMSYEIDKEVIPPGDSANLTISLDTLRIQDNEISQSVQIFCNDPQIPIAPIAFRVSINPDIVFSPAAVIMMDLQVGDEGQQDVKILPNLVKDFEILGVEPSDSRIKAKVEKNPNETEGGYIIHVSADTSEATIMNKASLQVRTTTQRHALITIPVYVGVNAEEVRLQQREQAQASGRGPFP